MYAYVRAQYLYILLHFDTYTVDLYVNHPDINKYVTTIHVLYWVLLIPSGVFALNLIVNAMSVDFTFSFFPLYNTALSVIGSDSISSSIDSVTLSFERMLSARFPLSSRLYTIHGDTVSPSHSNSCLQ